MSKTINDGVHTPHCCLLHGCKYGDEDCPVATGRLPQEYLCMECGYYGITDLDQIARIKSGEIGTCPQCYYPIDTAQEITELQAEVQTLKEKLEQAQYAAERYGDHDDDCPRYYVRSGKPCTCGFTSALKGAEQ